MNVTIKYAAGSDIGCVRQNNEDSAYAGPRLIAVADGMGGYAGGEVASSTVIGSLRSLDTDVPVDDLESALARAVAEANEKLRIAREERPDLSRMGTTLTAMLWSGTKAALAHIGDSRGYMLRDGELFQITKDHTMKELLNPDSGNGPDESAEASRLSHVLYRVLDGREDREPDLYRREARLGDRYLLCSDGLSGVVDPQTIYEVLTREAEPADAIGHLIALAREGGGPDNITCVIADVVEADQVGAVREPQIVGAAERL
ncbi:PP2C family protein-serine/threonine phosphatase [Thermomonospora curvata]|uniref:Protein serine/threonine phosphatase n=1 Tax=Thermomonospora curvata (strain ATCC 19995 / DSM 43183 / JCM 3096 / KCTC 9072 / NBRC 15933 / NCIMB 10081 / Henssen B9) TaxID=471852 RepID=D1A7D0_THECD|nr:protein phosphatase 2C domain-containing protein [Thermomonospora curvata]ACZ00336.1 protein serine/threonine phosphatase [Thermomonospora curvata DSM 43183]